MGKSSLNIWGYGFFYYINSIKNYAARGGYSNLRGRNSLMVTGWAIHIYIINIIFFSE